MVVVVVVATMMMVVVVTCGCLQSHLEHMVRCRAAMERYLPSQSCALTRIIRDGFMDNARIVLFVTLSRLQSHSRVTLHSLQFAQFAQGLHPIRNSNPSLSSSSSGVGHTLAGGDGASTAGSQVDWTVPAAAESHVSLQDRFSDALHAGLAVDDSDSSYGGMPGLHVSSGGSLLREWLSLPSL